MVAAHLASSQSSYFDFTVSFQNSPDFDSCRLSCCYEDSVDQRRFDLDFELFAAEPARKMASYYWRKMAPMVPDKKFVQMLDLRKVTSWFVNLNCFKLSLPNQTS